MELILPKECVLQVFDFLTFRDLQRYDITMLTYNDLREIYLDVVKDKKNVPICRWSFMRKIKHQSLMCSTANLKYVSDLITNLTVYNDRNVDGGFKLINHNLRELRVDLARSSNKSFNKLKSENLEILTMVCVSNIYIFNDLDFCCPKLKKITLIECDREITEEMIREKCGECVKVVVKNSK